VPACVLIFFLGSLIPATSGLASLIAGN